jgi:hypothetical protein
MRGCHTCGRGFHEECPSENERCCCFDGNTSDDLPMGSSDFDGSIGTDDPEILSQLLVDNTVDDFVPVEPGRRGRPHERPEKLRNVNSTGRKRANRAKPVDKRLPCEWQRKVNCGGGKNPIVGCMNGEQRHVHHGPDKDVMNNSIKNLHDICHACHNRWHVANDKDYDPYIPHEPKSVPIEEFIEAYTKAYPNNKQFK